MAGGELISSEPLLTIITPVLNGAAQVGECIENVAAQGHDHLEHIIVDGGSTDSTVEQIRTAARRHPHLRLIEGPDRGQSHAMNKGVMCANGSIIGCLNVDDRYYPGALACAAGGLADATAPAFLWGGCVVVTEDGSHTPVRAGSFRPELLLQGWDVEPHPINPVSYFYHRSLHFTAGLYDEADHYSLDVDFLLRASLHVKDVVRVDAVLGEYRLLPGTKTYTNMARHDSPGIALEPLYERYRPMLPLRQRVLRTPRRELRRELTRVYNAAPWVHRVRMRCLPSRRTPAS